MWETSSSEVLVTHHVTSECLKAQDHDLILQRQECLKCLFTCLSNFECHFVTCKVRRQKVTMYTTAV